MTQAPNRTVMLRNRSKSNITFELELYRPRTSMSLRRRTTQHCISLPANRSLDLCAALELPEEQVLTVLAKSPQAQRYRKRSLLTWSSVEPTTHE